MRSPGIFRGFSHLGGVQQRSSTRRRGCRPSLGTAWPGSPAALLAKRASVLYLSPANRRSRPPGLCRGGPVGDCPVRPARRTSPGSSESWATRCPYCCGGRISKSATAASVRLVQRLRGHRDVVARPRRGFRSPASVGDTVPLTDRGCATWAMIDLRTAEGRMWDGHPNLCRFRHALAPLEQSLAKSLTDWLHGVTPDGPYVHRELASRDSPQG